jgi:tRNA (cmo5U34)-methyltransferase
MRAMETIECRFVGLSIRPPVYDAVVSTEQQLESWHSESYVADWVGDDVIANMLELPRQISAALVADAGVNVTHVVDLGSGHGPYLELFLRAFPKARGTWVDSSEAMQEQARERLAGLADRIEFVLADVERIDEAAVDTADVVVTSRVLHHFSPESLQRVYRATRELLRDGGFLFNLDHVGAPDDWEQRYRRIRSQFTGARRRALAPHRHDYPLAPSAHHLTWIADAGYASADVPWRTLYTALLAARR